MTLVFALASRHRVLQVSDRQLTNIDPDTNVRTPVREPATKSVIFENRAIFGYTGLSRLERKRTDLWIADIIGEVDDGDPIKAIELVRAGLDRAFRPSRVLDPVPYHAVVVSGFRLLTDRSFQAFNALIANSPDERSPSRQFAVEMFDVPPGRMTLTQAPMWIRGESFTQLNRAIGRSAEHGGSFSGATDLLATAIRGVAGTRIEAGSDLIAVSIPVPRSLELGGAYIGRGRPVEAGGTFEYLSLNQAPGEIYYAPTMVMNGMITRDVIEGHSG